jgi:RNA 2',3'-cyclic 3'-phosphodiesterase
VIASARTHRLFVACECDGEIRETLLAAMETLRGKLGRNEADNIRWVGPDQLHVTIRFIGHVDHEVAARLTELFRPSIALPPFQCRFGPLQAFPSPRRPRVVSVGIDEGHASFEALHLEVSTRLMTMGVPPEERRYHPHVTVGRVREQVVRMSTLRNVLQDEEAIAGESLIDHVTLFESRLSPLGSSYTPLLRASLQGAIENA